MPCVTSDPNYVCVGVPQGSILGPLLFLVYIDDIVEDIESNINLFADDTRLYMVVGNPNAAGTILQNDINKITFWAETWLVRFNPSKSKCLIIIRKRNKLTHPDVLMFNTVIPLVDTHNLN